MTAHEKVDEVYQEIYGCTPTREDLAEIAIDQQTSLMHTVTAFELAVEAAPDNPFWQECLTIAKFM